MKKLGVLIAPEGSSAELLEDSEYATLRGCLELCRSDDIQLNSLASAIQSVSEGDRQERLNFNWIMGYTCFELDPGTTHEVSGFLAGHHRAVQLIDETEHCQSLAQYLKLLNAGGWLAEWLQRQIATAAEGNPTPAPLQVAQTLAGPIASYEEAREDAERFQQQQHAVRPGEAIRLQDAVETRTEPASAKPRRVHGGAHSLKSRKAS